MSDSQEKLIKQLRSARDDYEEELLEHRFLLDAYAGTGGFGGCVKRSASSFWGAAADMYGPSLSDVFRRGDVDLTESDSYLDRFPREDSKKFARRVQLAHYSNHVDVAIDIPLSFMSRQPMTLEGTEPVEDWMQDVNGDGMTWQQMVDEVVYPRAAAVGYCPVLYDLPAARVDDQGNTVEISKAQAEEDGERLHALPLFPANLLSWETQRNGAFRWCKVRMFEQQLSPMGERRRLEHITLWTAESATRWTIERDSQNKERVIVHGDVYPHTFGRVPIEVARWKPVPEDSVRGIPLIRNIAKSARRLFNYQSELDEHIRQSVFAMLQVPTKGDPAKFAGLDGGSGNAVPVPMDSRQPYQWLAPPAAPAEVLETRMKETRQDMYRQARLEFTQATGGQARSGVSRAFEFETTNRAIADFAKRMAVFTQRSLRLARTGINPAATSAGGDDKLRVVPPTKFAVEEMIQLLEETAEALDLDLGPTAELKLRMRIIKRLLPNLTAEEEQQVERELVERQEQAQREREQQNQLPDPNEDDPPDPDEPPDPNANPDDLPPGDDE